MSSKERAILNKKKEEVREAMHGRKKNVFTLDLGQKKVIKEKPVINFDPEELLKQDISVFEIQNGDNFNLPEGFVPVVSKYILVIRLFLYV